MRTSAFGAPAATHAQARDSDDARYEARAEGERSDARTGDSRSVARTQAGGASSSSSRSAERSCGTLRVWLCTAEATAVAAERPEEVEVQASSERRTLE